jgi:hypothetical protein
MRDGVQVVQYLVEWKDGSEDSWLLAEQLDQNSLAEAFRIFPSKEGEENGSLEEGADNSELTLGTLSKDQGTSGGSTVALGTEGTTSARSENFSSDSEEDEEVLKEPSLQNNIDRLAEGNYDRAGKYLIKARDTFVKGVRITDYFIFRKRRNSDQPKNLSHR